MGYAAVTFEHIALSDATGDKPGIIVAENSGKTAVV
jgi:hypothetical protein